MKLTFSSMGLQLIVFLDRDPGGWCGQSRMHGTTLQKAQKQQLHCGVSPLIQNMILSCRVYLIDNTQRVVTVNP